MRYLVPIKHWFIQHGTIQFTFRYVSKCIATIHIVPNHTKIPHGITAASTTAAADTAACYTHRSKSRCTNDKALGTRQWIYAQHAPSQPSAERTKIIVSWQTIRARGTISIIHQPSCPIIGVILVLVAGKPKHPRT